MSKLVGLATLDGETRVILESNLLMIDGQEINLVLRGIFIQENSTEQDITPPTDPTEPAEQQ